mgnify:CR=1 FL=1
MIIAVGRDERGRCTFVGRNKKYKMMKKLHLLKKTAAFLCVGALTVMSLLPQNPRQGNQAVLEALLDALSAAGMLPAELHRRDLTAPVFPCTATGHITALACRMALICRQSVAERSA